MTPDRETVLRAASSEEDRFIELRDQIDALFAEAQKPYLLSPDGERIDIPESAFEA